MGELSVVEFLEARIAEDEAVAREPRGQRWSTDSCYEIEDENGVCVLEVGHDGGYDWEGNVIQHFARYDPARVFAECEAKRAVIREHAGMVEGIERLSAVLPGNLNKDPDAHWRTATLRALAAVYKDHPDYVKVFPDRPQTAPAP